ncbi:MAG: hypothetical protein DRP81_08345 [Candidatus Omnitrophota bacterium]|nr:MAG: hypothetical protein DRP81_08345 [Candidatus Omnitrophota bacterium]
MQKMKLDKRILIVIVYVALFLEIFWFTPFQIKKFIHLFSEVGRLRKNIVQFSSQKNYQQNLLSRKKEISREIIELKSKIIAPQDVSALQAYLSRKAKENRLDIEEISPNSPQEYKITSQGKFLALPVDIILEADFHSLARFFGDLEKGDYFLAPKEMEVIGAKPYHRVNLELYALIKEGRW